MFRGAGGHDVRVYNFVVEEKYPQPLLLPLQDDVREGGGLLVVRGVDAAAAGEGDAVELKVRGLAARKKGRERRLGVVQRGEELSDSHLDRSAGRDDVQAHARLVGPAKRRDGGRAAADQLGKVRLARH